MHYLKCLVLYMPLHSSKVIEQGCGVGVSEGELETHFLALTNENRKTPFTLLRPSHFPRPRNCKGPFSKPKWDQLSTHSANPILDRRMKSLEQILTMIWSLRVERSLPQRKRDIGGA